MNQTKILGSTAETVSNSSGADAYQYASGTRDSMNFLLMGCKTNKPSNLEGLHYSPANTTNMSLYAEEESTSLNVVRNGSLEGYCKKYKQVHEHTNTIREMCLRIPTITTAVTARHLDSLLNCTVYLFNDKKDAKGYFQNPAYRYRATQKEEFLSVQDTRDNGVPVNATNLEPVNVASFETLMHFKVEMEQASVDDENTYMLIMDRQRTSFEWIVFSNHKRQIDATTYVYNGIALTELHVNDFIIELRDSMYEAQFDISA